MADNSEFAVCGQACKAGELCSNAPSDCENVAELHGTGDCDEGPGNVIVGNVRI